MISRRTAVLSALAVGALAAEPAEAFTFAPYDSEAVKKAIASGKAVAVHVYAPWCLQCRAQAMHLSSLSETKTYDGIAFFRVAYDDQADVVKALGVPRSTLIGYKGGKETARMSWGISEQSVVDVLKTLL